MAIIARWRIPPLLGLVSEPFANLEQRLSELLLVRFKLEGQAMRTSAVVNELSGRE